MTYDDQLEVVREAFTETGIDPVGYTLHQAFSALDDLMVMANRPETSAQVRAERILIGQLLTRCQTLASFALVSQPELKVIGGG